MDDGEGPQAQPMGFAQPDATPIGPYTSATLTLPSSSPDAPPQAFTVDGDPGPHLDQVAPAPPETRDPRQPFESGHDEQLPGQKDRDPRQPIITESFTGNGPDFAPPTGQPVVPDAKWGPPTGQPVSWGSRVPVDGNVGAIARPVGVPAPYDPQAARLAAMRGQPGGVPAWGPPGSAPQAGFPQPVAAPRMTEEDTIRARYWSASEGLGRFGVVMAALPWPVLVVLFVGMVAGTGWSSLAFFVAWIISGSNSKIAKLALSRCFSLVAVVFFATWALSMIAVGTGWVGNAGDASWTVLRWCCGILIMALPVVVWRSCERRS